MKSRPQTVTVSLSASVTQFIFLALCQFRPSTLSYIPLTDIGLEFEVRPSSPSMWRPRPSFYVTEGNETPSTLLCLILSFV